SVEQIVQPCPGVFEVLKLLKERGIPVALVSNGLGKGYGHEIMETFHLEPCFQAAVFREDIRQRKPHPEALLLAVERLGLKPGKNDVIWFIGDRHKDI